MTFCRHVIASTKKYVSSSEKGSGKQIVRFTRDGFTLFEVSISLAIVAFGVISVLMLIPSGIKAQQFSRYQILASARAIELIDAFSTASTGAQLIDREGPYPWDVATGYRAFAHDLEIATGTGRFGLMPLPLNIAKRIDSDGDEIQQILSEGGYVYYSNPMATSSINNIATFKNMPLPNETRRIICAVVGYAQQNAIPSLSYKDWPYYTPYPSPPVHMAVGGYGNLKTSLPQAPFSVVAHERANDGLNSGYGSVMLWENTLEADDGEMGIVFRAVVKGTDSNLPHTTKWVKACEAGGVLEKAKNHLGYFYLRDSGYLACCDQFGWIPEPQLLNPPTGYNPRATPKWPPNPNGTPYVANWQWRQNGADTSKVYSFSRMGADATKDMTGEMRDIIQPEKLQDFGGSQFDNPVAGISSKELAKEAAMAYFALALWYAREKGVSINILEGNQLADNANLLNQSTLYSSSSTTSPALAVNAARILGHAAMVLSGHLDNSSNGSFTLGECEIYREGTYPFDVDFPSLPSSNSSGIPQQPSVRPLLTKISSGTPNIRYDKTPAYSNVDLQRIKTYVDNATILGMRFAATFPYDWGSPRPLNRALMMDNPLLQYDMFERQRITPTSVITPFGLYNYGTRPPSTRYGYPTAQAPAQWRIASAQPIINVGRSQTYPSMDLRGMWPSITTNQGAGNSDAGGNPNHEHFTLARPFQVVERTRELVFWAVDWQAYEDFETTPSAPVDASRHPKIAPVETSNSAVNFGKLSGNSSRPDFLIRQPKAYFWERSQPGTRNPEKVLAYIQPTNDIETGYDLMYVAGVDQYLTSSNSVKPDHPSYTSLPMTGVAGAPPMPPRNPAMVFSGQYGADRNGNGNRLMETSNVSNGENWVKGFYGKLDRGTVPQSVRMRATLIARFNFYDPRLPVVIR